MTGGIEGTETDPSVRGHVTEGDPGHGHVTDVDPGGAGVERGQWNVVMTLDRDGRGEGGQTVKVGCTLEITY